MPLTDLKTKVVQNHVVVFLYEWQFCSIYYLAYVCTLGLCQKRFGGHTACPRKHALHKDPDLPPSILEVGRQPRVVPSSRNAVRGYACRAFGSAIAVRVNCTSADRLAGSAASVWPQSTSNPASTMLLHRAIGSPETFHPAFSSAFKASAGGPFTNSPIETPLSSLSVCRSFSCLHRDNTRCKKWTMSHTMDPF